jgi:hypothetical protein
VNSKAVDKINDLAYGSRYQAQEREFRSSCPSRKKDHKASEVRNKKISRDMGIDGNGILGCWWK